MRTEFELILNFQTLTEKHSFCHFTNKEAHTTELIYGWNYNCVETKGGDTTECSIYTRLSILLSSVL